MPTRRHHRSACCNGVPRADATTSRAAWSCTACPSAPTRRTALDSLPATPVHRRVLPLSHLPRRAMSRPCNTRASRLAGRNACAGQPHALPRASPPSSHFGGVLDLAVPPGGFYLWPALPLDGETACARLLAEAGVLVPRAPTRTRRRRRQSRTTTRAHRAGRRPRDLHGRRLTHVRRPGNFLRSSPDARSRRPHRRRFRVPRPV